MTALQLDGVRVTEPGSARPLLDLVTLSIEEGEFVALIGASGAGKTTLLEVAAGLRVPSAGSAVRSDRTAIAFHSPERMFFEPTVEEEIAFALRHRGLDPGACRELCLDVLSRVGLDTGYLPRHPLALSGGEQRLVALAAIIVAEPHLLLLDEPTAGLAAAHAARVIALLRALSQRGAAVLIATHEVDTIVPVVDRVLALDRGTLVADETPSDVFADFGIARFAAIGVPVPLRWRAEAALHAAPPSAPLVPLADRSAPPLTRYSPRTPRLPPPGVAGAMLAALLLALCFFLAAPLPWLGLLAVAAPFIAILTGADLRRSARLFIPLALLATFATAGHVLTTGGDVRLRIGPLEITDPGLEAGARTWLRIIGPVLVGLAVSGSTSPIAIARELRRLLAAVPIVRRLAAETGLAVLLVVRLVPLMRGEVVRIERAQRARGGPAPARGLARVRSLMSLAVPAIVTTLLRAERLALALELRGWSGRLRARGRLLRPADLGWIAGASMILGALAVAS